jgi:hypothetical protein
VFYVAIFYCVVIHGQQCCTKDTGDMTTYLYTFVHWFCRFLLYILCMTWGGKLRRYRDWLRAGRSEDLIPVGARFSSPVQTGPGAHPVPCTMSTGSFQGVDSGRGVTLTPHPLLVLRSKNRVELYLYSP